MTSRWIFGVAPSPTQWYTVPQDPKFVKHCIPTRKLLNVQPQNLKWWLVKDRPWIHVVHPAPPPGEQPTAFSLQFCTHAISLFQLFGQFLEFLSGWLPTTKHHQSRCDFNQKKRKWKIISIENNCDKRLLIARWYFCNIFRCTMAPETIISD